MRISAVPPVNSAFAELSEMPEDARVEVLAEEPLDEEPVDELEEDEPVEPLEDDEVELPELPWSALCTADEREELTRFKAV